MSDPLSDVLVALGTRSVRGTRLEASGSWSLAFDGRSRLKFTAIMRGQCWLRLPGHAPEALNEGDVFLLSDTSYVVASDPMIEPVDGTQLYAAPGQNVVRIGSGSETSMVGGGTGFADGSASFVLGALPSFIRIDHTSPHAEAVARTLAFLHVEIGHAKIGASLVAERLAEILVVEAIRAYVSVTPSNSVSWIAALADPRIGKALSAMHGDVARRWTVPLLATEAGMSRSAFTERFARRVGSPPLSHLTNWRMIVAQRKLDAGLSVAAVASEVGYNSQSAFAHAFKRTFGRTPRARQ
ncbi:AraC family transcriptional regulator [Qipengyuania qiaonensis]|uniref:AraC family transcriptional regulator n=1 Tax=Qipengyuania qiaonensis TaxID=2867240 RepID=A0ABS7JAQ3_9SPHN|nr:AraC family transcriptional regulator [Qipengyuania qiaonensis]MBX7483030.1 AraC family transcriptional regulator [Qipengyuania qiaonensis]